MQCCEVRSSKYTIELKPKIKEEYCTMLKSQHQEKNLEYFPATDEKNYQTNFENLYMTTREVYIKSSRNTVREMSSTARAVYKCIQRNLAGAILKIYRLVTKSCVDFQKLPLEFRNGCETKPPFLRWNNRV